MSNQVESIFKTKQIFLLAREVREICNPFFIKLGLTYFDYVRFYPNNEFIGLASDGDWVEHYLENIKNLYNCSRKSELIAHLVTTQVVDKLRVFIRLTD